jgi:hypothetical protein
VKYRKIAEGKWAPVKDESKPMTGHDDIERHALGISQVNEHIKAKTREQSTTEEIKEEARREAVKTVQEAMKQIFGSEMPEGLSKYFGKIQQGNDAKDIEKQKDAPTKLGEIEKELKSKKHKVSVEFTHNGKKYTHEFASIDGHSPEDVKGRVADLIKKRIPGAVIGRINTQDKAKGDDKKVKPASPKATWKDKPKEQPQMRQ